MAVFASRQIVMPVVPTPIAVTIFGTGNASGCYAIINGTKQYSAGTHEVNAGDTITFGVAGYITAGSVEIDGAEVLRVTSGVQTYDWIVPDGISTVEIGMSYVAQLGASGEITVTTA